MRGGRGAPYRLQKPSGMYSGKNRTHLQFKERLPRAGQHALYRAESLLAKGNLGGAT